MEVNIAEVPSRAIYLNTIEIGGLTPKGKERGKLRQGGDSNCGRR